MPRHDKRRIGNPPKGGRPAPGIVVLSIVYDGPLAVENLRRILPLYSSARRSELVERSESAPFVRLRVGGGIVAGHPIAAQLFATPAEWSLARVREALLAEADVIVFDCEASAAGLAEARLRWALLRTWLRRRSPILVVQASAPMTGPSLSHDALREALALAPDEAIVEGVRDTLLSAMRAAIRAVEPQLVSVGTQLMLADEDEDDFATRIAPPACADPPPLPRSDAPAGSCWPVHVGRAWVRLIERSIVHGTAAHRFQENDEIEVSVGTMLLRTSAERYFRSLEEATRALASVARSLVHEHTGRPRDVALALAEDAGGAWLWTITPNILQAV